MAENVRLNPAPFLYMGRNTVLEDVCWLGWSASSLGFATDARSLTLRLCTDAIPPERAFRCRAALYVDGRTERTFRLDGDMDVNLSLDGGMHRVELVRLSEAAFGSLGVREIAADSVNVRPLKRPAKTIEFIGDSITCGYGVEADAGDTFSTATENAVGAYAVQCAQMLGCGYSLVSWSGIGLISDWVPENAAAPDTTILMPGLYPQENLRLYERLGLESRRHAFVQDPADLAVINLGTNDQSWVKGIADREAAFEQAYGTFLDSVHRERPGTAILCVLGTMGTSLCPAVERAVSGFRRRHPKARAAFYALPEQVPEDDLGADGHPSPATHRKAAVLLAEIIGNYFVQGAFS